MLSRARIPLRQLARTTQHAPAMLRAYSQPPSPPPTSPANDASRTSSTTHFGFQEVRTEEKESLVKGVFSSVASSYDVMNDAMSMGVHRLWKDDLISQLNPGQADQTRPGIKCIDVAGGTGDIALRILDHARNKHADRTLSVQVVDINPEMLDEGRKRARKTMYWNTPQIAFHEGNAQEMEGFADNEFDLYTIAFGIRNCTDIPAVLQQAHRILKPGGVFACLEFSRVEQPVLAQLYDTYSFSVIPMLGSILAGDRDSYQYLVESIRRFPPQPEFARMINDAGFKAGKNGGWTDLWGGIACIHTGVKV